MQLERLKSPNKDTRYEACEELRVAESIPQEAFTALELAANDEDALVADAARRALLIHRLPPSRGREAVGGLAAVTPAELRTIAISFVLAIFFNVLFAVLFVWTTSAADLALCLSVSGVIIALGGGAGALLAERFGGNEWKGLTIGIWLGAVVSLAMLLLGVLAAGT
jgi:hypothetical protein